MKKAIAYLLISVLLLSLLPFAAFAAGLRGDANNDGIVNAKDVTILRRYLAGGYSVVMDEKIGDVNNDGVVNAKDVTVLRRYLAGGYNVELDPMPEDKKTYTDVVTGGQLYTDLGEPEFGEGKYTLSVLLDGEEQGDALKEKIVSGNTDALTPVGSVTEAEINETEKTVTVSTSKYYAAQITEVHPAEGNDPAYITLKQFDDNALPSGEATQTFTTDAFTEADVGNFVAYTKAEGLIQTAEPAEAKMGKITTGGVTATTVSLDGETYRFAATADSLTASVGAPVGICLDPNGNVLCSEKVSTGVIDGSLPVDDTEIFLGSIWIKDYSIFRAAAKADKEKGDPRTMPVEVPETIKLLVIGNSYGNDCSLNYLSSEFKALGVENVIVGTLYYSGCTYMQHLNFALNDKPVYDFYENGSGVKLNTCTFDEAIGYEDWTHIMLLHGFIGHDKDFAPTPWQDLMMYYLRRTRPNAYYGYDMTWGFRTDGYWTDSHRQSLEKYHGGDVMHMYNGQIEMVHTYVEPDERFKFVAPCGTAILNARSSIIGNGIHRDNMSHLNKGVGRYTATMAVCCTLTGVDPAQITYRPDSGLKTNLPAHLSLTTPNMLNKLEAIAKESVRNALAHPYEITQSRYTDDADPTPGENELPIN